MSIQTKQYNRVGTQVGSQVGVIELKETITIAERDALTPVEGMIANVATIGYQIYDGSAWVTFLDSGGGSVTGLLRATAGINFEASAGDTLQNYEIGTWTPTMSGSGGSAGTFAVASVEGVYQRIGNICIATAGVFDITNKGSWTGDVRVSLPFTSKTVSFAFFKGSSSRIQHHSFAGSLSPETIGDSYARFNQIQSGLGQTVWDWTDLVTTSGNFINFTIIFEIA